MLNDSCDVFGRKAAARKGRVTKTSAQALLFVVQRCAYAHGPAYRADVLQVLSTALRSFLGPRSPVKAASLRKVGEAVRAFYSQSVQDEVDEAQLAQTLRALLPETLFRVN